MKKNASLAPLPAAALLSLSDERLFTLQRMELLGRLFTRLLNEPPQRIARALSRFDTPPEAEDLDLDAAMEGTRVTSAIQLASSWLNLRLRRHEFEIQARPDAPPVPIATGLLAQAIANLLDNAVDAIESAGADEGSVSLAHTFSARAQTITVRDDGPGLPAAVQSRLFNPFSSTKPDARGSGLGLYVSRRIVTAVGGELNLVKSAPGGTVFEIVLPSGRRLSPPGSA